MSGKKFPSFLLAWILIISLLVAASAASLNRIKSMNIIKQVNRKGPYIGLITVFSTEENAFFATGAFRPDPTHPFVDLAGRRFRVGKVNEKRVIYVRCGMGLVNAAAATQQMLDVFDIRGVIHFGIAGNVNNSMQIGDVTIPKQFANTGIWDWLNPNATLGSDYITHLDVGRYNIPTGDESSNLLGRLGFDYEQFYSNSGKPNTAQKLLWAQVSEQWLQLAADLEDLQLEQCVNSTLCLPEKPKLVVGLQGSTADIFVDNAAYRDFLFQTFNVTSADMESAAVVMTCLSNGSPLIVIRGLSDLAGAQSGQNDYQTFGTLAAHNTAITVIRFINRLPSLKTIVLKSTVNV